MKKSYISLIALLASCTAFAQGLNKEITIEKEIVPEQRAATRLPVIHSVLTPDVKQSIPAFSSAGINSEIAPQMVTLPAALSGDTLVPSPYRGYAAIGYFPSYNLGASAGYRLIEKQKTLLGAWLQFDGYSYSRETVGAFNDAGKLDVKDNSLLLGVNLRQNLIPQGDLTVDVDFGYGKSKFAVKEYEKTVTQFHATAGWSHKRGNIDYAVKAFGGVFSNSMTNYSYEVPRQISYGGSVVADFNGLSLGVEALMLSFNHKELYEKGSLGEVTLTPAYTYKSKSTYLRLGLHAGFSINSGKTVTIAPDVRLDYRASNRFGIYAVADGGIKVNTMESVYDYLHFTVPTLYNNSRIPFDLRAGVVIGPFRGASLELFGGYAKADKWLLVAYSSMVGEDVKAWHAGAKLRYNFRNIVDAEARVEVAPSSGTKVYYMWRDRAKTVAGIDLKVYPFRKLTVEAGWELRSGRRVGEEPMLIGGPINYEMGNVNNLRFGASYRITQPLTVFARGENLLGKKWDLTGVVPANGVCGLIGVSYKF